VEIVLDHTCYVGELLVNLGGLLMDELGEFGGRPRLKRGRKDLIFQIL
jgi:hypothetical protein